MFPRSFLLYTALLLSMVFLGSAEDVAGCGDPVDEAFLQSSPAGARQLLDFVRWRSCYEETEISFVGGAWTTYSGVEKARHCCVKCKDRPQCLAWTWNDDGSCLLKRKVPTLRRVKSNSVSGTLRWRAGWYDTPGTPPESKTGIGNGDHQADVEEEEEDTSTNTPSPSPRPPASPSSSGPPSGSRSEKLSALQVGKVVGGRRLNSYLPCRNNMAANAEECSKKCVDEGDCTGWTFATKFNCGWVGDSEVAGLCYLMSETEDSAYDAPEGDLFVSGWS